MSTWQAFADAAPELAGFAEQRLAGRVAYLATVRADGGPRVHPITPIIAAGRLFIFMEPDSPKGQDLRRDGRYALHCSVEDNSGGAGECFLSGRAALVVDPAVRALAVAASSYAPRERYILFEFGVERVVATNYTEEQVVRRRWQADN